MFSRMQLKNGLEVILVESKKSPVLSIQMWVNTGSADETKGVEGVSHFIEHLLFKGTEKFGVGEIASTIEGSGGELNAYTSFDQTVFYVTISKEFAETGLEAISEMMGSPKFDPDEIDNEREVVIEEIKRGQDNSFRVSSRLLFSELYKNHPYGIPVIGFEKVIKKISAQKIQQYFRDRYSPGNMTLLVVGDFEKPDLKKKIQHHFGRIQENKKKKVVRKKEAKQESPRIKVEQTKFRESFLHIAWNTPKATHKDVPALEVLTTILGQGESSRLAQSLKFKSHLVNFISASMFSSKDPGFLAVSSSLAPEKLERMLEKLKEELLGLVGSYVSREELLKVKINFESEELYSLETVEGMARKFGTYQQLFGDYRAYKGYLRAVNKVGPEDLLRVARRYLKPENMTVVMCGPEEPASFQRALKKWVKTFEQDFKKAKKRVLQKAPRSPKGLKIKAKPSESSPTLERFEMSGGGILLVRPNTETPVISLKSAFLSGTRREGDRPEGVSELCSRTLTAGSPKLSEQEIQLFLDMKASGISGFSGRNTLGLSMTTLSPFIEEVLETYGEIISRPAFPDEAVEREKQQMMEALRNRQDNAAQVAIRNFLRIFFGDHPYARDPLGSLNSLESLSREDLKRFYGECNHRNNMVVSVSGDVDPGHIAQQLDARVFSQLPEGERFSKKFEFSYFSEPKKEFIYENKEQTHIVLGFPGLTFTDPDRFSLQVAQSVLAGQGGRLFLELRDKESLAYTVAPLRMEGIDAGYFGAYIACSPQKAAKAIGMMKEEFSKIAEIPISEAELNRAKRYLIGRHDIDLQSNSALAGSFLFEDIYGNDYSEVFKYPQRIEAVTSDRVQKLARKIFSHPETLCVVGQEQPW